MQSARRANFACGILGGGQMLAQNVVDSVNRKRVTDPTASSLDQAILDAYLGIQTPENVTQTRQATATDNAILQTFKQNKNTPANVPGNSTQARDALGNVQNNNTPASVNENVTQAEVESTAVNDNPATHTPQEQAVIEEYKSSTDDGLKEVFEEYLNDPKQKFSRHNINDVSERQAYDASRLLGGNYSNYKNAINTNGVAHMMKEHGPLGTVDHSMADLNDPARIGYVLHNYDTVEQTTYASGDADLSAEFRDANNKPAPMLKYSKKVNGTYYVVEAIPESKYKKFWVVSAYMEADGGTQASNATRPGNTPNASLASSPSTNSTVSAPTASVNTQNQVSQNFVQNDNAANNVSDILNNAREQYGTIPAGENPVREVSLPQSVDGETKVGRFSRTIAEASVTTQEAYEAIERLVERNRMSHEIATDDDALTKAAQTITMRMINGQSIESIRSQYISEAAQGKASKDLAAQGFMLFEQAVQAKDASAVVDLSVAMNRVATAAGQALQAQRMLKKLTPEWRLQAIQRSISGINESLLLSAIFANICT